MRDPKRIKRFCDELACIWEEECPDLRFGQFINYVFGEIIQRTSRDTFFMEEDEILAEIRKCFRKENYGRRSC